MTMRTNFQMVVDFKDYMPARRGWTSDAEMGKIVEHFGLAKMTALELQNLRDFVVLFYSQEDMRDKFQAMMSITSIIDMYKAII